MSKFRRSTTTPAEKLPGVQQNGERSGRHRRAVFARSGSGVGQDVAHAKSETTALGSLSAMEEEAEEEDPRGAMVHEHPLFEGISEELRSELMLNLRPYHVKPMVSHDIKSEYAREMFDSTFMRPRARTLLTQGKVPQDLNGLLVVHPDDFHVFEVLYNSVAHEPEVLPGCAGQEVALQITTLSPFTVKLREEPQHGFYYISTDILELLLGRHRADRSKLKETVYQAAQDFLSSWLMKHHTKVYVKLFANLDDDFKYALLNQVQIQFFKAEDLICRENEVGDSCIFVFTGEADIYCKHAFVGRMSQLPGTKAWESWWGALEVGGSCLERVASVRAYTDCVVWELSAKAMRDLWLLFPYECGFFDKVAMKHLQLLYPFTDRVSEINMFESCSADFTRVIRGLMVQKVYCRDELVMQEGDTGDEMYVLCVGKCSVFRGYNTEPLSHLHPGSCFGGLAVLNITRRRTATIKADCVCDLRALTRAALLEALSQYPGDKEKVREMVEAHSQSRQATSSALQRAGASEGGFSNQFLNILLDNMHEQPFLPKQVILEEGKESILTILLHGMIEVEVSGTHIANVVAPAIFGERGLLEPGSHSSATVRSCTVAECMILPPTSAAVPIIRARLPGDIARLERMLEKKMALTRNQLASTEDLTSAAAQQDKGLFGACSAEFLAKLGNYFERRVYLPDQKIISEGEEPRYGVMIHQGHAVVESQGVLIAECGPGEFLGEVAILGLSKTSSATVRAQTKIVAYTVEAHSMQEVLDEFPEERVRLREIMDKRAAKNIDAKASKQLATKSKSVNKFLKVVNARRTSTTPSEEMVVPKVEFEVIQEQSKRTLPGPVEGREWAQQRREKLLEAPKIRWKRMQRNGAVLEPLPAQQGVRVPHIKDSSKVAPFSKRRLRICKSLYGKMVWHEFLSPKKMMLTDKAGDAEKDAEELEAVLDAAEEGELWADEELEPEKVDLASLPVELLEEAKIPMGSFNDVAKFAAKLAKHAKEPKELKEASPEAEKPRVRQESIAASERTLSISADILDEELVVANLVHDLVEGVE